MNEESKIAIVSHGEVVEFDPNSAEHRKILESANRKLITNELYQRDLKRFKDLVLFYQSAVSKETIDDKIEEFLRATGIKLDYSDLAIFNYGYPDIDGYFGTLYNRAMGIEPPSVSADENPIVGLKENSLKPQLPSSHTGGELLYDILLRKFNRFMQNITTELLILGRGRSLTTECRIETNILRKIEGFNKETNLGLDREIVQNCPIDENLQTGYFNVLFVGLIKRSEEFRMQTIPLSEKVGFIQPKYGNDEGVKVNPNIRFWYDKFGVSHEIPPNKPMEAGSVKRNEGLVIVSQPSNNGGPIPSPDPRDESVRSKDTVIQNSISITTEKVNMRALDAACRTMAESMKVMHRKTISKECYDKLINELEFIFAEFRNVKERLARIYLYGKLLNDEMFKQKYGVVFSADEWNAFLNAKLSSVELAEKYVKVEEKKTLTRKEFDECLNALKAIMQLVGPNGVSRKDAESVEPLLDLLNTRFGLKITRHDFFKSNLSPTVSVGLP